MTKTPKVIFFNGPPGSGKDQCSEFACSKSPNIQEYKMAKPLKDACHKLLGLSGGLKDYENLKPVDIGIILGGEPIGMTLRQFYIHISENVMKPIFGKDIFGKLAVANIREMVKNQNAEIVVISDSGFVEEAMPVVQEVGIARALLIKLYRPGKDFSQDSRGYIDIPDVKTIELQNDGSLEDLSRAVHNLVYKLGS